MTLGVLLGPFPDKLRLTGVKWFILGHKVTQQQNRVSDGISMVYLVDFLSCPVCVCVLVDGSTSARHKLSSWIWKHSLFVWGLHFCLLCM